jgi:hypothetical protein
MYLFGFLETPEETIGALAILGLAGVAVYAFCRWVFAGPRSPDPWDSEVEEAVQREEAVPLCPHCLAPQEHNGWFCPECGSTVGQYGNYLPSVYIFTIGDAVRAGVQQRSPWTPLMVAGYVLLAFGWFSLLAPIYCLFLFINRERVMSQHQAPQPDELGA